ncbi:lysM domain receptor-like kinase 4 [Cornus florida]|uniref:lysM domain receptor-like kinase 4 n=1 Tax=Cornus florida TaxID=4283 RepID=UPI002899070C|nr:lysM domain receptor-like kinase 4 [Cornus florida]
MSKSMSPNNLLSLLFLLLPTWTTLFVTTFAYDVSINSTLMFPFNCSVIVKTCNSLLYHNNGLQEEQIASYYSVNTSQIKPISHGNKQDYLVSVPCSCKDVNGTVAYFYDTLYKVQPNDTFFNVSNQIYSGQAWNDGGEQHFVAGEEFPMHLLCGCVGSESQIVVTYTVQQGDTLVGISTQLSAKISDIENMNRNLIQNPGFIDVGWVLFVPMENNGTTVP